MKWSKVLAPSLKSTRTSISLSSFSSPRANKPKMPTFLPHIFALSFLHDSSVFQGHSSSITSLLKCLAYFTCPTDGKQRRCRLRWHGHRAYRFKDFLYLFKRYRNIQIPVFDIYCHKALSREWRGKVKGVMTISVLTVFYQLPHCTYS